MERCKPLKEYAIFVDTIRKYLKTENEPAIAAKKAVKECIEQGILRDILLNLYNLLNFTLYYPQPTGM